MYEVLLFLHILAGITWFGAVIFFEGMMAFAIRSGEARSIARTFSIGYRTTNRLAPVSSVAVLVFGIWMVLLREAWRLEQAWIAFAIAIVVLSIGAGIFYFSPQGQQIEALVEEKGSEDAETQSRIKMMINVGRVQAAALLVVLILMVWRPGL